MRSSQIAAADTADTAAAFGAGKPLALPDPDWLLNRLLVLAGWGGPGTCPLDLHRLIPIPGLSCCVFRSIVNTNSAGS